LQQLANFHANRRWNAHLEAIMKKTRENSQKSRLILFGNVLLVSVPWAISSLSQACWHQHHYGGSASLSLDTGKTNRHQHHYGAGAIANPASTTPKHV
jgi:hypothetical protein